MAVVSFYLRKHTDVQVNLNQVQAIREFSEESNINDEILDEVFYGESVESEKPEKEKREKKAPGKVKSVSLKISELEEIGSRYDFENATSSQIKHYILGSLEAFFKKNS